MQWLDQGTNRKRNTQRCVRDACYPKGLGHETSIKGIMGYRLVKLMQGTIILAFSLFLKDQYILLQCFTVEFYEVYSQKSETCLHFCFKFHEYLKDAASEIIQCEQAQKSCLVKI